MHGASHEARVDNQHLFARQVPPVQTGCHAGHPTKEAAMDDLSRRTAREVLDDHLDVANTWAAVPAEDALEEDLRRNVAEDIVILINRGTFRGHDGVRELARMLAEELPEHHAFDYTYVSAEDRIGLLEWSYEDSTVRVRDGVDSYLIEDGLIVAQTIHYTLDPR
jgi:hypothetical protein